MSWNDTFEKIKQLEATNNSQITTIRELRAEVEALKESANGRTKNILTRLETSMHQAHAYKLERDTAQAHATTLAECLDTQLTLCSEAALGTVIGDDKFIS